MKFFKADKEWEYNSQISKTDNEWIFYGEGYKLVSELIEKQILEIDRKNQDSLIYPYCFIIRHYIEIRLKEVIFEGNKILGNPTPKVNHDLSILWKTAQDVLQNVWRSDYEKAPKCVEDFIAEFHSIDVKSDNFRYPFDRTGQESLPKINEINFKKLSLIVEEVKQYLDGVTDGISAVINGL